MKAASSRARARKLLASAAAALAATLALGTTSAHAEDHSTTYPEGYPKVGTSSENQAGLWLKLGTSQRLMPNLFTVHTSASMEGAIKAYCIEMDVDVRYESDLRVGSWQDFPGTNAFKDNATVQSKVAWIAQRSYPQTDLAQLTQATGIAGLTEQEAITATQAAIWSFTNPQQYQYSGLVEADQATTTRVNQLFAYLTGEQNVGLQESAQPTVEVQAGSGLSYTAGENNSEGRVGPIRFASSQRTFKLTNTFKYELVDTQGTKVDTNAVPADTDLFLKVPAGTTSGEQEFTASVTGSVYAGKLLITKDAVAGGDHGQTIIIGSNEDVTTETQGKITWSSTQQSIPPKVETTQPAPETTQPAPQTTQPAPQTTQPAPETTPAAPETTPASTSTETSRSTSTETSRSTSTETSRSTSTETSRSTSTETSGSTSQSSQPSSQSSQPSTQSSQPSTQSSQPSTTAPMPADPADPPATHKPGLPKTGN